MMQKVTTILLGVLAFMLIARLFIPAEFGVWGLFIIIASIVETTRNALIRNGYIVFKNTKDAAHEASIELSSLVINIGFTLLLLIVFIFLGGLIETSLRAPGLSTILLYYSFGLLLLIPYSQKEIFLYSKMDFKAIFSMYFFRNGIFTLIVALIFFLKLQVTLQGLTIVYILCIIPGWLSGAYFSRGYDRIRMEWNAQMFKSFFSFGKYVFGNNFFSLIFVNTDTFMTARIMSTSVSTFYNIGARVLNFADIPSQVFGDIMFPKAAQIVKSGNDADIKRIYEMTVAATLCFVFPFVIVGFAFSEVAILILAGGKYLGAAAILRVMLFYSLFLPFIKQFGNIMDAKGKPHVNFWLMFSFSIINISINYICIMRFGMTGAAFGSLASYILLFMTTQYILGRVIKSNPLNVLRNVIHLYPEFFAIIKSFVFKRLKKYEK